jgi:NADH:ubiquinone oxidoreductase subunit F (NADH-binding)
MNPTLIPSLLRIQERCGYLPEHELEFLAVHAGVPLYRLEELSTFFPHFRRTEPPAVAVHVCESMSCQLRGAPALLASARELAKEKGAKELEVRGVSCLGRCDRAPVALLSRHARGEPGSHPHLYTGLGQSAGRNITDLIHAFLAGSIPQPDHDRPSDPPPVPDSPWEIDPYQKPGNAPTPYAAVRQFLSDGADRKKPPAEKLTAEAVLDRLGKAYLFGMGGAAANTARKWDEVRKAAATRPGGAYVVCNGDESEPGTFKDREILLHAPHLVVEGMLLAGLILHGAGGGPVRGYVYIRHEYPEQIAACQEEIEKAHRAVPEALERCRLEVFTSPGAYICGEESALLEAIEGKRAQPRNQPPSIRANGLNDRPTLVNNVETFAWLPALVLGHSGWWRQAPRRFFSISGDVARPGVFEVPFTDTTLGQLIDRAGGMRDGMSFKAVAPSGPSGGFLPARLRLKKPLGDILSDRAIGALAKRSPHAEKWARAFRDASPDRVEIDVRELLLDKQLFMLLELDLGAGIMIFGDRASLLDQALNALRFFEKESCGKCVPCRLGCQQLVHLAAGLTEPAAGATRGQVETTARALATAMEVTSICGLGRSAANPLTTLLDHFEADLPTPAEKRP